MKTIIISLLLVVSIANSNRILSEISSTSNKWQFNLFTSTAEQNSQSYQLEGQELLLIQNTISEDGKNQIKMNKYLRDGTSLNSAKTLGDQSKACTKPKVIIIPNIGFVLGWIQKTDQDTSLYLQLFNNNLIGIGEQIEVSKINEEIHWDLSSEYYYVYNVGNYELLLLYKEPNNEKSWSGTIYNYNTQKRSDIITLSNSKFIEIAQNNIGNIILLQRIQFGVINSYLVATKLNLSGQIVYSKTLKHIRLQAQYEPRLVALSNNNFVLFYQYAEQIYYQVYNQHFDQILFTSNSKYQVNQTPNWEFNNFFRGGQIQVLALEESVVLVGVNYNTLRFQLIQLDNDFLQFIQQREIHYEDLNIYKFTIQKTNYQTIFVQWISGNPLTLLPEFTQSLYQSELNLKLTLSDCGKNCGLCENNTCIKCATGYILNNNKCQIQCQINCILCSTQNTCDACASGFILNNKMNCVEQDSIITQELKVSISELTHKYNQQVKQLKDGSILVYYQEYFNQQQVLQFRLLTSDGEIIQAYQINNLNWAGYDIALENDTTAYLYTIEKSEGYSVIKQRQFNPRTFEFSNVIRLQIQNQGFQYRQDIENSLIAIEFENSVCLMLKGLDSGDNINLSLSFYTYSGELLINQYIGQIQIQQNFSFNDEEQRFDYDYDDFYFYIIISRGCSIQMIQFNQFGQRIYEEYYQYSQSNECQDFINPSISKISNKFKFMIAIEASHKIIVFNWKDSVSIYQTDYKITAKKPHLISFNDNSFVLLYEEYDLNERFTTIKYLRFEFNDVVVDNIINSQSVLPQNLKMLNQDNEYLILNWLACSASKIQSTNHVYLEKISINDNLVIGFGKQCPANCENCNSDKECVTCNSDYFLNELKKCQLKCSLGCQSCTTKSLCLVCQQGYQLNQLSICEQSQKNSIAILKENIKIIESIDLDLAQNGNVYISWMERNQQNTQTTFIKQIDIHGSQVGKEIQIKACTEYASKIFTTSYFNILSTICGNIEKGAELYLHFYNLNFDARFSDWIDSGIKIIGYSIQDTPYAIQVVSEREIIIVQQIMNSENDVSLRLSKLYKQDFDNIFILSTIQTFGNYNQKLQDLQLSFDLQYYFITFKIHVQLENGSTQLQKQKITTDYNLNQINNEQTLNINQQLLILSNKNKLEVSNDNAQIKFIITHGNKQLFKYTIQENNLDTQLSIEQIDVASTEQGFYIIWIQLSSLIQLNQYVNENNEVFIEQIVLPPKKQIKAQGFYNNGTQITEIQDLIQSSNMPNKIFVQSLRNNQLFVVWQDQDETGQKLFATRYNKMLQLLPLNTALCQAHCDICSTSNSCGKCSNGYYYNTEQSQCQLICPSNCQVCSRKDICDICQQSYYLINDQCVYDTQKQQERILANVEDSTITTVSMSAFSDNGFVVVWNDNLNGKQALFMQLFNNLKEEQELFPLSSENDKRYAQVEVLEGDLIALAWFEGQCSDTCRLQLQIFDRFGSIQTTEITIAFVTLPPLEKQSPVVIKSYERNLIIAFITYENGKTVGYSTIYQQDTQTVLPNQLIDPDHNVDNLQIIAKNGYHHGLLYLRNNNELILQNYYKVQCTNDYYWYYWYYWYWNQDWLWTWYIRGVCGIDNQLVIVGSQNKIQQATGIMRSDSHLIVSWVERINKNGFLIDTTYFTRCWSTGCEGKKEININSWDETYLPQLVGQYSQFGQQRYSIIYGIQGYFTNIRKTIKLQSYFDYETIDRTIQVSIQSQLLQQFDTFEFTNGDVFIITVGQTGEQSSQILMNVVNLFGDQQKLTGYPNCQQHCQKCDASLTCFNCNSGYNLIDGQCQRQCDKYCRICDPYWNSNQLQCYECEFGYQLNNFQQCLPTDTSIIQVLINTYQNGNQYGQRVATLSNYQSIVVWNSENQDKNGKSIYMQLYDQQMSKIGSETLITKDNIGIQEEPDIVALPNNQFIIIWKDNHSNTGRRILMQRFTLALERVGDEIVVYDSQNDIATTAQQQINYVDVHHKIIITQRGYISILLFLQQSSNYFEIKLKQYNNDYQEITSQLIGYTLSYEQTSISTLNTLLLITWKSKEGVRVIFVNELGANVNGLLIPDSSTNSYPSITAISENEILISCVGSKYNQLLVYRQNLELTSNENPKVIQLDYQIQDVNLLSMNSGFVIVCKQKKQTLQYQSDLINLLIFNKDGDQIQTNNIQVNDYYGLIRDIRIASLTNDEFIITWTQIINNFNGGQINQRDIEDQSGNGVYVKRYNMIGQVQSIENIVCQSYCKQCSKQNLCEACSDGYQFDENKLICLPICTQNCNSCTRIIGQLRSYCQSCKEGFTVNEYGDCIKQQEQQVSQLYSFDGGDFKVYQILTLTDGNIVIIYQMYIGDIFYIDIIDNAGQVIVQRKSLDGTCCRKLTKATALTSGNFAIIQRSFEWFQEGELQLIVFDSAGRIIKSDQLHYSNYWNYVDYWRNQNLLQINSLSDGGFVLLFVTNYNQASSTNIPQLHLRIYNKEFNLIRNDIIIQTYFKRGDNQYYWDYWNYAEPYYRNQQNQGISVLESVNSIIITFGTHLYNNWEENKSSIQVFVYSKEGQFILNKQVDIPNNDWWIAGFTPRYFLFEIEINKFFLIYFNNRQVFGQYYDEKFNFQEEKSINLESSNQNYCYGCCPGCWDYISTQVALIKNVIVITNKPNIIELYLSSYNLNFNLITPPLKVSNNRFDYWDPIRNQHFLLNYQLETLLLAQTYYQLGNRYIMFNKFDKNCNKIKQWSGCSENCLDCAENNKQCLTCQNGYFVDENNKCKQNCDIKSCLFCENISSQAQFCRICQDGYQLKDNIECVQIDNSRIKETKLLSSTHLAQNTPRVKALQDGRILLISLSQNNRILGQFYNSKGEVIGDQVVLLEEDGINHFDFAVSSNQDQIVIAWVSNIQNNAKALRFTIDLQIDNNSQIIVVDNVNQYGIQQITIEFLQNNSSFVCVLFGSFYNWIRIVNELNEPQSIQQILQYYSSYCDYWGNCYICDQYWGCWYCGWQQCNPYYYYYGYGYWYNSQIQQRYIDYFTASFEREPSVLVTQNYVVVAFADYRSLQLRTFDLNGNLLFQKELQTTSQYQYGASYQPSIAQLENGKIVIVWKDILNSYNNILHEQQVESYKQTVIAYTITDEQFQNINIQFIGMDYVQEDRPDVAAISNGFAISWSGRSEKNNQNIDLRIAYFDLYGNLQTGFIPVSSICSRPINSQIAKLYDGSILVSWYQDNDIYVSKLDRNGVLYPLPQPIGCPLYCTKCDKDICLECFIGYELDNQSQCQIIVPKCQVENCQVCEFGTQRCMLCKEGYFLEENFDFCSQIDNSANKEYLLAQSNVINDHSTSIVLIEDGTIIHLWLDTKEDGYILKGSTYTSAGSQFINKKEVQVLPKDVYMQVKSQNSNIIVLIYNQHISSIYLFDSYLEVVNPKVDVIDIIKEEFSISYEWWSQKLNTYNDGLVIEITGIKQQIINQFSLNPEIKRCAVTKIFVFDLSVQLATQPFGFYLDGQPSTGIVDQNNQCKISQVHDLLYDNKIYVLTSRQDLNSFSIQAYSYNGEKLGEVVIDYWNWYGWDWWNQQDSLKLFKLNDFQIISIGNQGKGLKINSQNLQNEGTVDFLTYNINQYSIDKEFVQISPDEYVQVNQQEFGLVSRWRYQVYQYYQMGNYGFVSRSAVRQQSFNIIRLQDGQELFSWIEAGNNQNTGNIMMVRLNQNRELDKFQNFQCLANCRQCSNDYTCDFCYDGYENLNNKECRVICPSLCEICDEPTTCKVCQENAYLNDSNLCYVPEIPQIEIAIPIKRSDDQINPRVASFNDGSFVIVWQSENQDGDGYGIYVQRFNSQIEKIGDEIRVNVNILNNQYYPDITILENQNVIIVWADGNIETQATLYYQRFKKNLSRIGNPVIIDNIKVQYIQQYDTPFVIQSLPLNKFVICWINDIDGMSNLYVSLIDSNGVQLNTFSQNSPEQVREVVIASNGLNFVVISKYNCLLRAIVFNLDGIDQQTQDLWPGCSTSAGITVNSLGEYIVSYIESGNVVIQQYNNQFGLLNTTPKLDQDGGFDSDADNPDVITLNGDKIVVVWQNNDRLSPPRSRKLKFQILDNAGVTISDVKEVNLLTTYPQLPQLSLLNNDEFIVVWQGIHQKSLIDSEYGIYLMRFNHDGIKTNPSVPICPDKCEKCQESKTCLKCQLDYELVDNLCKSKCPSNCSFCDTSNICDICLPGFELNTVGNCVYINPDPLPIRIQYPTSPIKQYPSFKSIQKYGSTSVLIYAASIIQKDSKNYLDVNLILISDIDNSNINFNSLIEVDQEWLNIYNSDILVINDEIIIYWTEQSYNVSKIQLKQLRLNSNLVQQGQETIDSFDFNLNEHINRKVYLFSLNQNYYIFQSIPNNYGSFEFYGHIVDKQGLFVRASLIKISDTNNIIQRKQILIVNNEFIVLDYLLEIRWFKFDQNLMNLGNGMSTKYFQEDVDYSSIAIEQLPNQQFICAWRSRSQQYQSQMNYIQYRILTSDFQFISQEQQVIASNNVIQNPQIVVTNEMFYIIWNQESIVSSMINCKQYTQSGQYINEIQKLNRLDNNVQYYTGTNISDDNIYIIWISYSSTIQEYQYYISKVGPSGRLPIIGVDPYVCPTGCEKCSNEYSCAQCLPGYFYDSVKYRCYLPCTNNCKDCLSDIGICKVCDEGYKLIDNVCQYNICQQGCQLCDEFQNCLKCNKSFEPVDKYICKYSCDVNCEICGVDKCNQCKESYYWSEIDQQCVDITVYIYLTSKDQPLKAVFESKDYVLMWYESGVNEGIYIQLYRSNGKPVGRPTKVNEEDLLGTRRLLQQSNNFDVRLFADLTAIKNELVVLWVDQTQGDVMKLKFKKFDNNNKQLSSTITINEQPKQNLTSMAAPCIIKPTTNNQFIIGWFNKQEENLKQTATMFIQSFNTQLTPIGSTSAFQNADFTKVPLIQASEKGEIYITYTSLGYTYLAQMSQEGKQIGDTLQVSHIYQTIKSTNLDNGNMVYVFESQSTNVSPPQFVLSYEIVQQDKKENQPRILTQQQYGEQHPDIVAISGGFVIAWRSVDKSFKSQDIYFQIFDNSGEAKSQQIKVKRQGFHPQNPRIQILNQDELLISWTAESRGDSTKNSLFQESFQLSVALNNSTTEDQNITKIICSSNCLYCETTNTCIACQDGYYTVNNQCVIDCPLNCQSCSTPLICNLCEVGYQNTTDNQCAFIGCDQGYKLNDNNECIPECSDNCLACQSLTYCLECDINYYLNNGQCQSTENTIETYAKKSDTQMPYYQNIIIAVSILLFLACLFYSYKLYQKNLLKRANGNQVEEIIPQNTIITTNQEQPENLQFD